MCKISAVVVKSIEGERFMMLLSDMVYNSRKDTIWMAHSPGTNVVKYLKCTNIIKIDVELTVFFSSS